MDYTTCTPPLTKKKHVMAGLSFGLAKSGVLGAVNHAKITALASEDMHYVFLAAVIFSRMVAFLNFYPASSYKKLILRRKSGNLRANMMFFKNLNESTVTSYIGMEDEGDVGMIETEITR